jgi:hypothetical protein
MTPSDKSYTEQLADVRADFDVWRIEVDEPAKEAERQHYQEYADRWARMTELAIRALGAGEDVQVVADKIMGRPIMQWHDVDEFSQILYGHLRHWVIRAAGIKP